MTCDSKQKIRIFPPGFLWGTATSSHQVEGNNNNDWTAWEAEGGSKHRSGLACGHWDINQFKKDVEIMKDLKLNSYRLSLEWSRIVPRPGVVDVCALKHYRLMLKILKEAGLTVMVTLHHFTNPRWFVERGGWERGPLSHFGHYVKTVARALKEYVDLWTTINEPLGLVFMGWLWGVWPPGRKRNIRAAVKVARHLARAHNLAYKIIKTHSAKPVGLAHSMIAYEPPSHNFLDRTVAWVVHQIANQWILRKTKNDFIGLNYYMPKRLRLLLSPLKVVDVKSDRPLSDFGWEIYPQGIYKMLVSLKKYKTPIYITENGVADASDSLRASFIKEHLCWTHKAIEEGVPVRGYFHWSLLDNFEWAEGYGKRFGLVGVDFETQERFVRQSAYFYRNIVLANAIVE